MEWKVATFKFIDRLLVNKKAILFLFALIAILASIQSYAQKDRKFLEDGYVHTHYNNYVIFKQSFHHLIEGKDLYSLYPEEHWDLYKYSPTFALFFGIFAWMHDFIGLTLWNILNSLLLVLAIYYLPRIDLRTKGLISAIVFIELLTSLQNEQSNALMAGLIILAFGLLEREKYFWAILCIISTFYIKIFGIVALSLLIFYPQKWKLALYTFFWSAVFLVLPLLVVDAGQLGFLYQSWKHLLLDDHSISFGLSVTGWLLTWFNLDVNKNLLVLTGAAIFCLPLLRIKEYKNYSFRLLLLSSILTWVVIFNHKAESPTFIIAISGVALWYYSQPYKTENLILLLFAFVFTSLATTDLCPRFIKNEFMRPYVMKAVPCIFVWIKIVADMLFGRSVGKWENDASPTENVDTRNTNQASFLVKK